MIFERFLLTYKDDKTEKYKRLDDKINKTDTINIIIIRNISGTL